jgi:hypothetical protein
MVQQNYVDVKEPLYASTCGSYDGDFIVPTRCYCSFLLTRFVQRNPGSEAHIVAKVSTVGS